MIPILITLVSVFIFSVFFILYKEAYKKDIDSFIIKDIENRDIFPIIQEIKKSGDNFYILTNKKDDKLFSYLSKYFYLEEAFFLVHRDN